MRFSEAIVAKRGEGLIPVIADIKCRSPKEGDLLRKRAPEDIAAVLKKAGAPCLSVVTERDSFAGSLDMLERVASRTQLPILCKDFFRSKSEIKEAKNAGASAVLLILACLTAKDFTSLYLEASSMGLEVVAEIHDEQEMASVKETGAGIIGINNRDIRSLEMDDAGVELTTRLALLSPPGSILISESGIRDERDARLAVRSGANALLVGSAILKAEDMAGFYKSLMEAEL